MNEQRKKGYAWTGNRTHDLCSKYPAIEAQPSHIVLFSEWYLSMESILGRRNVYNALRYIEAFSNQAKLMVNSYRLIEGKYDYSKERKGEYVISKYNTRILLPSIFDKQTDKKRYAWSGNRTHDQDWFSWPLL